jgi:hypothetical protein
MATEPRNEPANTPATGEPRSYVPWILGLFGLAILFLLIAGGLGFLEWKMGLQPDNPAPKPAPAVGLPSDQQLEPVPTHPAPGR